MLAGGCRISHHLRDCDHYFGFRLGFRSTGTAHHLPSPWPLYPFSSPITRHSLPRSSHQRRIPSSSSSVLPSKSSGEIPVLSDCFSPREDDRELYSEGLSSLTGGIVALGKFDALHIGHRELVIQASKIGPPFLLSLVGIAEVLGWEPRAPIVAKCDRKQVLAQWAPYCGGTAPTEYHIDFSSVRQLAPRQFVEKLSKELGVRGVVAGENYRFGYKAAGNASDLVRLCEEFGIGAHIIKSVMDKKQLGVVNFRDSKERGQVSSTRVRHALAIGDMKYVSELLGRHHRLALIMAGQNPDEFSQSKSRLSISKSCLLNLAPRDGVYENCYAFTRCENPIPCKIAIDPTFVHVEMDEVGSCLIIESRDSQLLRIEFGD